MLIDLKNCYVYFEDGHTLTGAVNLLAGYAAGLSTIAVDAIVGSVPDGVRLTFAGDVNQYTVVSATDTSGNTTSITFTPPLVTALVDNQVLTAGPRFLRVKVGEGQLTWSEKKPREYKGDRGTIDQVRNADEVPMDVSFSFNYEELTASTPASDPPTPEDVLKNRDPADDWETSDSTDPCAPYAVNIKIEHIPPCTDIKDEIVTMPYFRYEELNHDPKAGTITCTGKCRATEAVVTRRAKTN